MAAKHGQQDRVRVGNSRFFRQAGVLRIWHPSGKTAKKFIVSEGIELFEYLRVASNCHIV